MKKCPSMSEIRSSEDFVATCEVIKPSDNQATLPPPTVQTESASESNGAKRFFHSLVARFSDEKSVDVGDARSDTSKYSKKSSTSSKLHHDGPEPRMSIDLVEEQTLSCAYRQIPERTVFGKGCGAFGYFQVLTDVLKPWSSGALFGATLSKQISVFVRFSMWNGNEGSPETLRDLRGFSIRFYTDEGNFDLVGINLPVFFIRNPSLFPALIRIIKRHPTTNLRDKNTYWSFFADHPQTIHLLLMLYSDRGLPAGYRHMNGYSCHAHKLVNKQTGDFIYARFSWRASFGVRNMSPKDADRLAALQPDFCSRDFYKSIASGEPPTWELYAQIMTPEQARKVTFSPFDCTKVWPKRCFPTHLVGKITLNQNPCDYFSDVDQVCFSPGNFTPGIEASPDPMFQTRLSVYAKSAIYRVGRNYGQLPVNKESEVCMMKSHLAQAKPINSVNDKQSEVDLAEQFTLAAIDHSEETNFHQVKKFYARVLDGDAKKRLSDNLATELKDINPEIQRKLLEMFHKVNPQLSKSVATDIDRWQALKGSWTRPEEVPALIAAYLHYGLDHLSISTPNLAEYVEHGSFGSSKKDGKKAKKIRENCRVQ